MTFYEYININNKEFKAISEYYLSILDSLSSSRFNNYDELLRFKGTSNKFIDSISEVCYLPDEQRIEINNVVDNFINKTNQYRRTTSRRLSNSLFKYRTNMVFESVLESFSALQTTVIEQINKANRYQSFRSDNTLNLNGFYNPAGTNKEQVIKLINEAIELLRTDITLTQKAKNQIINHLKRVIDELDNNYTRWTSILGHIKETILVLGALGSFIGGASVLSDVGQKLEETTKIIQQGSITINYQIVNENFNIENVQSLNIYSQKLLQDQNETVIQLNDDTF